MSIWLFLLVILSVCIADICWTMYFIETEKRRPVSAAMWSSLIMIAGTFTTTQYVSDRRYAIAAIIGAFIGTYIAVEWKRRSEIDK